MSNTPTLDPIGMALYGFSLAGAVLATADIVLALADGPEIPLRINLILVATLATTISVLTVVRLHRRQMADMEGIAASQARTERSLETVRSALVRQSAQLVEVTGEIPRFVEPVRGVASVTPTIEAAPVSDVLPSPATLAAMRRLARKVANGE